MIEQPILPPPFKPGIDMGEFRLYDPIVPIRKPYNRHDKRETEREYQKLFKCLYPIEKAFTDNAVNGELTYEGSYEYCLSRYRAACQYIKLAIKPKWFTINKDYFSISFKPQTV